MARDCPVKVAFSADEFLALRAMAEEEGLSQSAYLRRLAKEKMREFVMNQLSSDRDDIAMGERGANRAYVSHVNPVVALPETRKRGR